MRNQQRDRANQGFTLLELLVVIIIIGVLAGILAPAWLAFVERQRLNTAQSEVYQAFQTAKSNAINDKMTWQASFRENNNTLQWAVHPASVEPANALWKDFHPNIRLDDETTLQQSGGVRRIQFDHFGNVENPPFGRVTLSSLNGGNVKRCVFISTIIGAMRTASENPTPKNGKYCY